MGCIRHVNMGNSYCLFCTQKKKKSLSDDMVSFAFVTSQDVCHLEGRHVGCLLITGIWTRRKNFESAATSTVVLWMDSEKNFASINDSFLR